MPNTPPQYLPNVVYKVLTAYFTDALADRINDRLAEGWQLYGNITTTSYVDKGKTVIVFTQALIKEVAQ